MGNCQLTTTNIKAQSYRNSYGYYTFDDAKMPISLTPSESQHTLIKDGWFGEDDLQWPGQKFCLEVEEVILNGKSKYQDVLVFKSKSYGMVLVLDGVIQVTERDEFAYQEMIVHLPMFAAKDPPKKVLIVGGGDGGVLREVVKHTGVEEIHMCEIDEQVVEVGKQYFSKSMATAFDDPRVKLIIDDAARFLREEGPGQNYDVIICDSSDPVGPADVLFQPAFFQSMRDALRPGSGVVCTQGQCLWLDMDFIEDVMGKIRGHIFPSVTYAYTTIPTYTSGQIGFIIASQDASVDASVPRGDCTEEALAPMQLRYYSKELHSASFVLPAFAAIRLRQT